MNSRIEVRNWKKKFCLKCLFCFLVEALIQTIGIFEVQGTLLIQSCHLILLSWKYTVEGLCLYCHVPTKPHKCTVIRRKSCQYSNTTRVALANLNYKCTVMFHNKFICCQLFHLSSSILAKLFLKCYEIPIAYTNVMYLFHFET